jgi:cell fate (sporulation/competence/biofilm development) regulator YlbF (YheA/YmcA/DUF963 family)
MNVLEQKIKEVSEAIRATREWQAYHRAKTAFQNDEGAKKLLNDYHMAQQTLSILEQGDFSGQEEQRKTTADLLDRVRQNIIINDHAKGQKDLQALKG